MKNNELVSEAMNSLREKLKQRVGVHAVLLLILALGCALRLPGLDRDLWFDEASSLLNARGTDALTTKIIPNGPEFTSEIFTRGGGWHESLLSISHVEWTPPLYFLLLRLWIKVFGESDHILRLLSVIIGVLAILVMFFLGRNLFGEKVGSAAAGVLAILPLHIQYSQEVRAYPLAVLLVTLASWAFWKAYQAVGQRKERLYWLLYLGLAAASLYTHYFAAWALIAHGLFALMQPRAPRLALVKRLAFVAVALVILLAPWLMSRYFENQLNLLKVQPYGPAFWTPETFKRLLALTLYFFAGTLPDVQFKSGFGLILLILYVTGLLLPLSVVRKRDQRLPLLFSFLLLVAPILFMTGTAALLNKAGLIAHPKFVLPALTGLCLLFGVAMLSSRQRVASVLLIILAAALSVHFQVKWYNLNSRSSPPWWLYGNVSAAVTAVNRSIRPNELILFDDGALVPIWNIYERTPRLQVLMDSRSFYFNDPMDFESRWQEVKAKYAGIYLVRRVDMPLTEALSRLDTEYRLISDERVQWLEIRHYRQPSSLAPVEDESR